MVKFMTWDLKKIIQKKKNNWQLDLIIKHFRKLIYFFEKNNLNKLTIINLFVASIMLIYKPIIRLKKLSNNANNYFIAIINI